MGKAKRFTKSNQGKVKSIEEGSVLQNLKRRYFCQGYLPASYP